MEDLLSIGKMAELCGISIQRLRYYSNLNLVAPVYINPENNYRYYTIDQKQTIFLIQTLQYLGLTLQDIAEFIAENQISKQTIKKIAGYIQKEEDKIARIKRITSILFETQMTTSQPAFFSTLEVSCKNDTAVFDYGSEWVAASMYFRKELLKRNLSLSYLFFCGIKQQLNDGQKCYSYYMELPGIAVESLPQENYADYQELHTHEEHYSKHLNTSRTTYLLKLPGIDTKSSYRILQAKW
ncbi:MerR family transcriptional regulator [Enterococcus sp. LJL51]|uniref:MerR family transcriptional regulator n=1 Tax=Enterococcus sp. LJL51 TaxID=3416656 RepID=UPI003CF79E30